MARLMGLLTCKAHFVFSVHTLTHIHTDRHTYMYTYILHAHTDTYIHTYTHTHPSSCQQEVEGRCGSGQVSNHLPEWVEEPFWAEP